MCTAHVKSGRLTRAEKVHEGPLKVTDSQVLAEFSSKLAEKAKEPKNIDAVEAAQFMADANGQTALMSVMEELLTMNTSKLEGQAAKAAWVYDLAMHLSEMPVSPVKAVALQQLADKYEVLESGKAQIESTQNC